MYELNLEGSSTPTPSHTTFHQWDVNRLRIPTPPTPIPLDQGSILPALIIRLDLSFQIPHEVSVPPDKDCCGAHTHTQQVQLPYLNSWRKVVIKCISSPISSRMMFLGFLESQPSVSFSILNPTDPTEYDDPLAHNHCCTTQNVDACRAHQRSFDLCPPSLTSLPLFTLSSNNLISPTRTNLCHHVPSIILGFSLALSLPHTPIFTASSRRRLLRPASDKSSLSSAHNYKLYASALRHAPLTHNPFLTQITSQYLVFVPCVTSSLLCFPSPGDYYVPSALLSVHASHPRSLLLPFINYSCFVATQ